MLFYHFGDDFMKKVSLLVLMIFPLQSFALETKEGEWIAGRKYDYRYITNYEVKNVSRPLSGFPWIEEDCHDEGGRFAHWSKSLSYEITYGGQLKFSLLGFVEIDFGAERSKAIQLTFQRWVTPTRGIRARHILTEEYQNWVGETQVEKRYTDGRTEMSNNKYPFKLSKMNYGISVEREVLEVCENF